MSSNPASASAFASAAAGDSEALRLILAQPGAPWDCRDDDGITPLMAAARAGHTHCARLLADSGADLDARDASGRTALIHASAAGHADCARALLLAGSDPRRYGRDGRDALDCATMNGHDRLAIMLRGWMVDAAGARAAAARQSSRPRP